MTLEDFEEDQFYFGLLISKEALRYVVCPLTRTPLVYNSTTHELFSLKAKLAFPIYKGMPVILMDKARPLSLEEVRSYS